MTKRMSMLIGLTTLALLAGPALALEPGDPAPAINLQWVKGGPHDLKAGKGKNVFVIEFWATWCGPCRMSMPHLTELQKKYKDKGLVIIGVAMSDEATETINAFLKVMGDKVGFSIGIDKNNDTARAYMAPVGARGIPYSFVIDKEGRFVWHGSPFELDPIIEQCLAGTFNYKARPALIKYFEAAVAADQAENADQKKDLAKKARELGEEVLKIAAKNPDVLDMLCWNIMTLQVLKTRDVDLAKKASKMAYEASEGKDPSILDTYARILWETGEKAKAVEVQKKAVELGKDLDPQVVTSMKARLKEYLNKMPASAPATQASR